MAYELNDGERELQRRFDSERLAEAIRTRTVHDRIDERDQAFIERMDMFFLATVDARGNVDCSYKGGDPGFIRVLDEHTLAFPSYDGNGQFMSGGNIATNGKVGMLFIDWERQNRMRVNGTASIDFDDPLLAEYPEAQFVVRVQAEEIFPNCPRYIHKMQMVERSRFVPKDACETPDAEWKDHFEEVLPEDQRKRRQARASE
ncbi:MAG: pyridoxamine 5'-phosphate oxidase family protein [Dehalococcoidia bacterium]|nr:pyridoxamine 5'-phosphate oxidase family protein [Dehalococcoidia bacterium]MCB9486644.1 pyridoxamine 5'-phosphate oxidase family protein [Thermoflexaceae bacterium]